MPKRSKPSTWKCNECSNFFAAAPLQRHLRVRHGFELSVAFCNEQLLRQALKLPNGLKQLAPLDLTSKRAQRISEYSHCDYCEVRFSGRWRYHITSRGEVILCEPCRSQLLGKPTVDHLSLASPHDARAHSKAPRIDSGHSVVYPQKTQVFSAGCAANSSY